MAEPSAISVNFGKPMPLFPLGWATVLPQQVLPLHIFEPRYRQMVEDVLDDSGQIAMAVFRGESWKQEYHGVPPIRPYVCVAQIVQHEKLPDGRFTILVHGVCRARVRRELLPDERHMYRRAILEPVGLESDEAELAPTRERLARALAQGPLTSMAAAQPVLEYVENEQIPTAAVLELVGFTMLSDHETRYRLLAEADAAARARLVERELGQLSDLIRRATAQHPEQWPKGVSWN